MRTNKAANQNVANYKKLASDTFKKGARTLNPNKIQPLPMKDAKGLMKPTPAMEANTRGISKMYGIVSKEAPGGVQPRKPYKPLPATLKPIKKKQ